MAGLGWLDWAAIGYLALPTVLFFAGWMVWWVWIPVLFLLAAAVVRFWRAEVGAPRPRSRPAVLAVVLAVAIGWSVLGGAGHLFFANFDWVVRDVVLRDLVVGAWPVGYGERDGVELLLRAPLGYYLPAAVAGKAFGLQSADAALLAWTVTGVALFLGLAVDRLRSSWSVMVVLTVIVLFSGMDLMGTVLRGGYTLATHLRPTDHVEWWADRFQYSSHTTQLFWVPNHALAGWIATAMLVRHREHPSFMIILPVIVALVPIWSPLTAVGLLPIAGAWWLQQVFRERSLRYVDPVGIAAAFSIATVAAAYLLMGAGGIRSGVTMGVGEAWSFFVPHYLQFVLLEAGILWLLLLAVQADLLLIVAGLLLWTLPILAFGPSNDLAMRGSIPALIILALAAASAIATPAVALRRRVFWPILVVLLLGAPTAIMEMARAASEPAWKPDYSKSLVPGPTTEIPAHYVAPLNWELVSRMLRPPRDVNSVHAAPREAHLVGDTQR